MMEIFVIFYGLLLVPTTKVKHLYPPQLTGRLTNWLFTKCDRGFETQGGYSGINGNFGLNCVRTISLAEIRTQKNTRIFFRPKKIQELKILDPKKYVGPPRHVYTRVPHLG